LTAGVFYGWPRADRDYKMEVSTWEVSKVMFLIFSTLHFGRVVMCLVIEIAAKWMFLGRRQQGRYNWYVFYIAVVVCLLETNY
jgi:hypothetical protein